MNVLYGIGLGNLLNYPRNYSNTNKHQQKVDTTVRKCAELSENRLKRAEDIMNNFRRDAAAPQK